MEILGYILLGAVGMAVTVYLFYLCRAIIAIAAILLAVYLLFFKDSLLAAGIVIGGWLVLHNATEKIIRKFADAANRRYMNFSELYKVGMKFEPKNQGMQYIDIQRDINSVAFL